LDIIAGLTVCAILVPEGMAYAELAGIPPETAFYAAPVALLAYAVLGSSRALDARPSEGESRQRMHSPTTLMRRAQHDCGRALPRDG